MSFSPLPARRSSAMTSVDRGVARAPRRPSRRREALSRTSTSVSNGSASRSAAIASRQRSEQLALLGVHDAVGELDGHGGAYCQRRCDARHVVDPSAYTPPYDHALCAALARAGADVELVTSRFAYGDVPRRARLRRSRALLPLRPGGAGRRCGARSSRSTCPTCCAPPRARAADVVHFQWLAVQPLDAHLLRAYSAPRVLTAHDVLPREPRPGQLDAQRRLYERVDAIVVHSEHGRERLVDELGVPAERVHVIPHGRPAPAPATPRAAAPSSPRRRRHRRPVLRPAAPVQGHRRAASRRGGGSSDAELWIVGHAARWTPRRCAPPRRRACASSSASSATARPRRSSAAPTSSCCPTARSTSPACSSPRWRFGVPLLLTAVGGFPEIAAAGAAELVAPGDRGGAARRPARLLDDPARARHAWRRARCAGRRAARLGRDRARAPRALRRRCWRDRGRRRRSGSPPACSSTRRSAIRCCSRLLGRARRGRRVDAAARRRRAVGVARHRRPRRGARHRGEGRQRARARLARASASRSSSPATARPTTPPAARARAPGADVVLDLPRGGKVRAQDAAVERAARRAARLLRRQRALGARRAARARRRRSPTRASATPAARCASSTTAAPTRRACTGATRWRIRALRVAAGLGHRAATARSTRCAARPTSRRPGHGPRPLAPVQHGQARLARGLRARRRARPRRWSPPIEGEFARKRRMMSHAWPIVLRGGLLSPRGYPPLYALMIASHRAAALRHAVPARRRAGRQRRACSASGWVYVVALVAPGRAARPPRSRARVVRVAPAARRALLRPDHGVDRRRAVGLAAPRARRPAGARRRARGDGAARLRRRASPGRRCWSRRRCCSSRCSRSAWSRAAARSTASAASARTASAFDVLKLRTMVTGAEHMGAGLAVSEGDTRITRVGALLRRTSLDELPNLVNVLRGEMAIVGPRPTVPVQVDRYTERQRGRLAVKPGHHRLGAGQRARVAAVVRAHRARPLVHRAPLAGGSTCGSCWRTVRMLLGGDGLYRGEAPAWRDPPNDP